MLTMKFGPHPASRARAALATLGAVCVALPGWSAIPESEYPAHCQQSLQQWLPMPAQADLMVITAHPDDEGIFFGGALPYYTQVEQRTTVLIGMNGDTNNHANIDRREELERAAWHYGVRHQPINFGYPDVNSNVANQWEPGLGQLGVAMRLATEIRRFRPEVILTHDLNGEYGHAAHQVTAAATVQAFAIAADASVDLDGLEVWQPQKLYLHLYQSPGGNQPVPNELVSANGYMYHSWEETFDELGGRSSRDVANEALQCHQDPLRVWPDLQVSSRAVVGEVFDGHHAEDWGLGLTEVGPDTTHSDFFQNILRGDLDADGFVGVNDMDIVMANWGESVLLGSRIDGDVIANGVVDEADLQIVLDHWGTGTPPGSVPEPGSLAALAAGTLAMGRRRRPRSTASLLSRTQMRPASTHARGQHLPERL